MRVLFIVNHPEAGATSRYRVYQYLPYLRRHGVEYVVRPFTSRALYSVMHRARHYPRKVLLTLGAAVRRLTDLSRVGKFDLLFVHREAFPFGPPWMEAALRWRNPCMVYDFDDAVYVGHRSLAEMTDPFLYKLKYGRRFKRIISMSRCVIAGNRILAAAAGESNHNVSIIPTVVDLETYEVKKAPSGRTPLVIGWIGSQSTEMHLGFVRPVFEDLLRKYGRDVRIRIVGASRFRPFDSRIEVKAWSLREEMSDLRSFDIGIMPLFDDAWTRGKCAFKAIQYMGVGVPAVCSPVGIVEDFISDGENGLIARSRREWVEKLSLIIENRSLRERLGRAGRKTVERYFSLQVWAPRFLETLKCALRLKSGGER